MTTYRQICRIFGILTALAIMVMLVVPLLTNSSHGPPPPAADIRFTHSGGSEDFEFWQQTIADFQRANPAISVRQVFFEGRDIQYDTPFPRQIVREALSEVTLLDLAAFRGFSERFENLSAWNTASSFGGLEPTAVRAFQVDGEQLGIPFSGANLLIFLNRKSFQKASEFHGRPVELPGEDWTIAHFLQTAEALTCDFDRDRQTDQFGLWLPQWAQFLPFIWSFGADITDEQASRWTFSGPAAQSAMRFYRQLATGDRVVRREEEVPLLSQNASFLAGTTGMCVDGPGFLPILDKSGLAGDYAVAQIPRGPGGRATRIRWDGIVMRKNLPPDRRDRAWRFIEWTVSMEVQRRLARLGRALPARVDVREEFVAADPPRRKPFVDALAYSRLQPPLPQFEAIDRAITRHFEEAIDPLRAFDAMTMLDALARDPAVVSAFTGSPRESP